MRSAFVSLIARPRANVDTSTTSLGKAVAHLVLTAKGELAAAGPGVGPQDPLGEVGGGPHQPGGASSSSALGGWRQRPLPKSSRKHAAWDHSPWLAR